MARIPLWLDPSRLPDASDSIQAEAESLGIDGILGRDDLRAQSVRIDTSEDQDHAARVEGRILVEGGAWMIIPLENLIAARRDRADSLYALAKTLEEVEQYRTTLEVGVHGIVFQPDALSDLRKAETLLQRLGPREAETEAKAWHPKLVQAKLVSIEDAGLGDRVCVDTTSQFHGDEGLLIGSTSQSQILVQAETTQNDFVEARPFRVNAGALHAYSFQPGGRTSYLSDLRAGAKLMAVRTNGETREVTVGRAKIERRPHLLLQWEGPNGPGSAILQLAETVRLLTPAGSVPVTDLKPGDPLWIHEAQASRHFGMDVTSWSEER